MMAHPYPHPYPTSSMSVMTRPSFLLIARRIYTRDGLGGFFRGLGPCFLRTFPVNASAIFVYEGIMRALGAEKVHKYNSIATLTLSSYTPEQTR
jgi:solute carrier family 25 (mitochondrial carnitine/acylcarnitine transporter), member 20/29